MKKLLTTSFLLVFISLHFGLIGQNLIENWDANGATGVGSDAGTAGWIGTPTVTWGEANQAGTIRYIDNPANYTYKGAPWTGRILTVRWDGTGGSNTTTVFAYPVALEGGKNYLFTGRFAWNSNGSGTSTYTIGINSAANNSGTMLASNTLSILSTNKLILYDDTLLVSPATTGTYYLTIKNNTAIMGACGDLSIVEVADPCLSELNSQYNALTLGDISSVSSNITLPSGTGGVTISWVTSNPSVITNSGIISQPDKYRVPFKLTATVNATCNSTVYNLTKEFTGFIAPINPPASELIAHWDFSPGSITKTNDTLRVTDVSGNNLIGKVINEARIRTIGSSTKYNVLDLGNNKGYFDMGTEIGKAIYSLSDYTVCAFFRVDEGYTALSSAGNFLWSFSNAENQELTRNGYIISRLNVQGQSVSTNYYGTGNQAIQVGTPANQGAWHHFAFVQQGDSAKIYIDGVVLAKGRISNLPFKALPKEGLTGTLYNWIGRSPYESRGDVYLRQTLVYDFQLISTALSADDINISYLEVPNKINALNIAYLENPDNQLPELQTEASNLTLGDLSAVTSNITLPTQGTIDNTISISWRTSNPLVISNTGTVNRPDYFNSNVTLTAVLFKNGQEVFKTFPATVLVKDGTSFSDDLIVKFDFAAERISDTTVTDAAEKHFTGTMKNSATIRKIGNPGGQINVLDLGNSNGYFDMGTEFGKTLYGLNNFTVGCYFLIDSTYSEITSNGNFLWSLSNSDKVLSEKNGYIFGSLKAQAVDITATDYNTAKAVSLNTPATKDNRWHHMAYTLEGTVGKLYIDGVNVATNEAVTITPSTALPLSGRLGTLYNWLGRSCYATDVYLRKTLVYDFRMYKRALTQTEIELGLMAVNSTIAALNNAYIANPNIPVYTKKVESSLYKILSQNGYIQIVGLKGNEKIALFDITGRRLLVRNPEQIAVKSGIYIVKINNQTQKVIIK